MLKKQELIKKAKNWLLKNTYKHVDDNKLSMTFRYTYDAIEDFEKAMEE
jgi:3-methyladenine DNA glycosylase AlkD